MAPKCNAITAIVDKCRYHTGQTCNTGDARLKFDKGPDSYVPGREGRLEVCRDGEWGTVISDRFHSTSFGTVEAGVVCRQLGYEFEGELFIYGDSELTQSHKNNIIETEARVAVLSRLLEK